MASKWLCTINFAMSKLPRPGSFRRPKGASIKYVRAEGEGGCQRNGQFLRTIVLIGCVKSVREGGEGVQNPGNFAYVLYGCSLMTSFA